jgi:hypothetical protein
VGLEAPVFRGVGDDRSRRHVRHALPPTHPHGCGH